MDFGAWTQSESDPARTRRLAVGYATGVGVCLAVGLVAAVLRAAPPPVEDDAIDVKLAATVAEAAPAAAPPPPPPIDAPKVAGPAGPRKRSLAAPTAVPSELPREGDPANARAGSGDEAYGDSGGGTGGPSGGSGAGASAPSAQAIAAPPPPRQAPKTAGPIQLPEDATAPVALSNAQPAYPSEARSAGVEATVVVKFVVTESGDVTNVTIVRGHPMFDAAVLAAVRTWRYRPALVAGRPTAVYRVARIPFKLKT